MVCYKLAFVPKCNGKDVPALFLSDFKGLKPQTGLFMTAIPLSFLVQFIGLAGYLDGFRDDLDRFDLALFRWDWPTGIYTGVMLIAWIAMILVTIQAKEDYRMKIGGAALASLPTLLFLVVFVNHLTH